MSLDQQLYYDGTRFDTQEETQTAAIALGEAQARAEYSGD